MTYCGNQDHFTTNMFITSLDFTFALSLVISSSSNMMEQKQFGLLSILCIFSDNVSVNKHRKLWYSPTSYVKMHIRNVLAKTFL